MCFDVPKVVRSPGCDHGHDEESRNGRDMKIDILDDYIRTPEWFRGLSDKYQSTGGLPEPPGGYWASWAQLVEEERRPRGSHAPLPPKSELDKEGGGAPLSFPPLSPSLSSPNPTRKREGVLLPVGVGLLLARPSWSAAPLPLAPLYTGVGGTLETQQLIIDLLAVCGAPLHHSPPR